MANPLLTTKLHRPPVRSTLVSRPQLVARLDQALARRLTLISAPPGFGKTTLAAAWLAQQPLPSAWYSLDERDNDLTRFIAYLLAALETVQPDVGRHALAKLRSRRRPPLESIMTLLCNDIAAMRRDLVLVLDDYHLIELPAIHEAMAFLLDQPALPLHLVLATRADPPLPLARLRARGQLVELRAPDLRFTLDETASFLNQQMGLDLTPEQIAALETRAEGWIAGLQLAALSVQGRQDVEAFVHAFAGSHRFVLDYLAEEVLQRQTPETQTFLLQTSILDQMNAPLADAVTGRTDSALVLGQLDKANLFVIPLDDARRWYRYHHLFADLLQSRLAESPPAEIAALHQRASAWYEENGFPNEAVDHALAARDYDRAVHLIQGAVMGLFMRSEVNTLLSWLTALPDEFVGTHPVVDLIRGSALLAAGKIGMEQAEAILADLDDSQLGPQMHALVDLARVIFPLFRTDLHAAIAAARRSLAVVTSSADLDKSIAAYRTEYGLYLVTILAELQIAAGQLREALVTYQSGLDMGRRLASNNPWGIVLSMTHIRLAALLYEWNDLDGARRHASTGLEISRAERNEEYESYGLAELALVKQAQGDSAAAYELIRQAGALGHKRNFPTELAYLAPREVCVLLAQARTEEAALVIDDLPGDERIVFDMEQRPPSVVRARVLIAQAAYLEALHVLEPAVPAAEAGGQIGTLVEVLALEAVANHGLGNSAAARDALVQALAHTEPEGYVRTFVDLGEPMRALLADYGSRVDAGLYDAGQPTDDSGNLRPYVDRLLAAFKASSFSALETKTEDAGQPPPPIIIPRNGTSKSEIINPKSEMVEPLSDRELAVLRLVDQGLSNQEIADRLVVAVSTVKTHINNIFGKLGVNSRTQALARARELGLLSDQ